MVVHIHSFIKILNEFCVGIKHVKEEENFSYVAKLLVVILKWYMINYGNGGC